MEVPQVFIGVNAQAIDFSARIMELERVVQELDNAVTRHEKTVNILEFQLEVSRCSMLSCEDTLVNVRKEISERRYSLEEMRETEIVWIEQEEDTQRAMEIFLSKEQEQLMRLSEIKMKHAAKESELHQEKAKLEQKREESAAVRQQMAMLQMEQLEREVRDMEKAVEEKEQKMIVLKVVMGIDLNAMRIKERLEIQVINMLDKEIWMRRVRWSEMEKYEEIVREGREIERLTVTLEERRTRLHEMELKRADKESCLHQSEAELEQLRDECAAKRRELTSHKQLQSAREEDAYIRELMDTMINHVVSEENESFNSTSDFISAPVFDSVEAQIPMNETESVPEIIEIESEEDAPHAAFNTSTSLIVSENDLSETVNQETHTHPFGCSHCSASFTTTDEFSDHACDRAMMKTTCDCGMVFNTRKDFNSHFYATHLKADFRNGDECKICSIKFPAGQGTIAHWKEHGKIHRPKTVRRMVQLDTQVAVVQPLTTAAVAPLPFDIASITRVAEQYLLRNNLELTFRPAALAVTDAPPMKRRKIDVVAIIDEEVTPMKT